MSNTNTTNLHTAPTPTTSPASTHENALTKLGHTVQKALHKIEADVKHAEEVLVAGVSHLHISPAEVAKLEHEAEAEIEHLNQELVQKFPSLLSKLGISAAEQGPLLSEFNTLDKKALAVIEKLLTTTANQIDSNTATNAGPAPASPTVVADTSTDTTTPAEAPAAAPAPDATDTTTHADVQATGEATDMSAH